MRLADVQREVEAWVSQWEDAYWPPLANLARLVEEVGELARELNHRYGPKVKKPSEAAGDVAEELGDILFVVGALANSQGIDLTAAFQQVLTKYRTRDAGRWRPREPAAPPSPANLGGASVNPLPDPSPKGGIYVSVDVRPEPTPNPNAVKFTVSRPVAEGGSLMVDSGEKAAGHPLASRLWTIAGVAGLLLQGNFITVTRAPGTDWHTLVPQVQAAIKDHFVT